MPFDANSYNAQYKRDNYDQILLRVPKGMREEIAKEASNRGLSVNQYIISLVEEDRKNV